MTEATLTNGEATTATTVVGGEPYAWTTGEDAPPPVPPAKKKSATPGRPPHWLDEWVKCFTPEGLVERLNEEFERRGLLTPQDFEQAPMKVVAALQRVLQLDATTIINLSQWMEDSGNG